MKIVKLAPSQRKEGRWLIWLEDGSLLRAGQNEVADFGLYQGMELNGDTLERLKASAAEAAMKNKALNALTARPMSRRELTDKLTARPRRHADAEEGEEPERDEEALRAHADAVADRLEELGLIDDASYAVQVARHYAAKGYGERKIRDELYRRGVPKEHWDAALEGLDAPDEAIEAFLEKKLRGWMGDPKELKRASDALARRGFCWNDISAALRRYEERLEDSDL